MKRYVITGGTSSGKTSALLALNIDHGIPTVFESAESYIRLEQAKGHAEPWSDLASFQTEVARLHYKWETDFYMHSLGKVGSVVLDRSPIDCLAFLRRANMHTPPTIDSIIQSLDRYDGVFLFENVGRLEPSEVRRENLEDAIELEALHETIYREFGYDPIRVPAMPLEERVQIILDHLEK